MIDLPGWALSVIVLFFGSVIGGALWTIRTMAQRLLTDLDQRLIRIDAVALDVQRVDTDLKRLMIELPLHYQRREDAIRETTVILARIDAVGMRIDTFVRRDDHIRSETVLNAKLDALALAMNRILGDKL